MRARRSLLRPPCAKGAVRNLRFLTGGLTVWGIGTPSASLFGWHLPLHRGGFGALQPSFLPCTLLFHDRKAGVLSYVHAGWGAASGTDAGSRFRRLVCNGNRTGQQGCSSVLLGNAGGKNLTCKILRILPGLTNASRQELGRILRIRSFFGILPGGRGRVRRRPDPVHHADG